MRPTRYKREFAVAQTVADMKRRFVYPDEDTQPANPVVGGGGSAPTIVVAAADATGLSKSKADFICTGVNDHQTIMGAYSMLPANFPGGRLLLTEGQFNCAYGQLVMTLRPVTVQGMGQNITFLNFDGGTGHGIEFAIGGDTLRDLVIIGSGPGAAVRLHAGEGTRVNNVLFGNSGPGIKIERTTSAAREVSITDCFFKNGGIGIDATPVSGLRGLMVVGNHFLEISDDAIRCSGSAAGIVIANNHINVFTGASTTDGVVIDGCLGVTITGNWLNVMGDGIRLTGATRDFAVVGNSVTTIFRHGIYATGSDVVDGVIAANTVDKSDEHGVFVENASRLAVLNNSISQPLRHGIVLDGASACSVADNQLVLGPEANNTYDGIHIANNSDHNYVHGNTVIPSPTALLTRYGINVAGGACNIVVGNDLGDPADYGVDALNDAGADTQLFYPADATYGDNFTDCSPTSPTSP